MFKKTIPLTTLFALLSSIIACSSTQNTSPICTKLKRQLVYNNTNLNYEASWISKSQKEEFKRKLIENNCP